MATTYPGRRDSLVEPGAVSPDPVTDPITISVTDHQARRIDLSDPSLGEISGLVGTLVSDVTLSVPGDHPLHDVGAARRRARSLSCARSLRRTRPHARGRYAAGLSPRHTDLWEWCAVAPSVAQKFVATSSTTKLVCSEESSVSANFSVTFVPL